MYNTTSHRVVNARNKRQKQPRSAEVALTETELIPSQPALTMNTIKIAFLMAASVHIPSGLDEIV